MTTFISAEWANAERTTLRAVMADGSVCFVPAAPGNSDFRLITEGQAAREDQDAVAPLAIAPFARYATLQEAQAARIAELEARAAARRTAVVGGAADATKMSVYREKYLVAVAALGGDRDALALLAPEATARGETPEQLAGLVKSLGDAWRSAGLAIDAVYQAKKAALLAAATIAAVEAVDLEAGWP